MSLKEKKGKIAILYICTGKYEVFWKKFYKSSIKRLIPDYSKDYYVFTDAVSIYKEEQKNVHKIEQRCLGWPYDTLMRFHMFLQIEEELNTYDYIFFFNANSYIPRKITAQEFLPEKEHLLFVQHPGMYRSNPEEFTFERNPESRAYIPMGEGRVYVCGGINGGRSDEYLKVIRELKYRIDEDLSKDIIAVYHDESQINRYVYENEGYKLLPPSYCYPEGWKMPFPKKIIILDKSKYFNDREIKQGK